VSLAAECVDGGHGRRRGSAQVVGAEEHRDVLRTLAETASL
jgi:hypothetical protein